MAYVVHHPYQFLKSSVFGEGDNKGACAQLAELAWAHQHKHDMPRTPLWRPGKRLIDCKPGELMPGTVLATFDVHGRYLGKHGSSHTVLYVDLTLDKNGRPSMLGVIHQYQRQVTHGVVEVGKKPYSYVFTDHPKHDVFHFGPNPYHYKDARNYCVVESLHGASGR